MYSLQWWASGRQAGQDQRVPRSQSVQKQVVKSKNEPFAILQSCSKKINNHTWTRNSNIPIWCLTAQGFFRHCSHVNKPQDLYLILYRHGLVEAQPHCQPAAIDIKLHAVYLNTFKAPKNCLIIWSYTRDYENQAFYWYYRPIVMNYNLERSGKQVINTSIDKMCKEETLEISSLSHI